MTDPLNNPEKPVELKAPSEVEELKAPVEEPIDETPKEEAPVQETPPAEPEVEPKAPSEIEGEKREDETPPVEETAPAESADAAPAQENAPVAEGAPAEGEAAPKRRKREPRPEPPDFSRRIEAILFATDQPLSPRRIADALESSEGRVKEVIRELRDHYDADGRAFTVEEIAGGFQIMTRADFGGIVKALFEVEREHKLSQAALETLAIVAYKQPIIRAVIEDIRGVQVQPILKTLQEQGLIRIVGRAEQLGRPMLYGTTQKFLVTFGLKSAKDLPPVEELRKKQ